MLTSVKSVSADGRIGIRHIKRSALHIVKSIVADSGNAILHRNADKLIRKAFLEEIPDTTKIIIAQRISSVEEADKIIVMDKGRVSAFGSHSELLETSSIYREVYESQMKGSDENG